MNLKYQAYNNAEEYKNNKLSKRQIEIIDKCSCLWSTARQLSNEFNCTVQSVSVQLLSLHRRGFLMREALPDPTGGIEYSYFIEDCLRKEK